MQLTPKIVAYIGHVEGMVQEAYKDGGGVWTWAMGVTNASGRIIYPTYKDNPQSMEECIKGSIDLMKNHYLPAVERVFQGHELTEVQIAAALSFQWHFGAISKAGWVVDWCQGKPTSAKVNFLQWTDHGRALARAKIEQAMFFDGVWPADIRCPVYPVSKPSYTPAFAKAKLVDLLPQITTIMNQA